MHPLGKFIILLCLFIILSSLIFKDSNDESIKSLAKNVPAPSIAPPQQGIKSGIEELLSLNSTAPKIDLQGPLRCELKQEAGQANIYISNRQIKANFIAGTETTSVLIKDDKVYFFSSNKKTGTVTEGANQYLNLFETFSSLLPGTSILSVLEGFLPKDIITKDFSKNLLNECEKKDFDEAVFKLPVDVSFTDVSFDELMQSSAQYLPDINN